MGFGSADCDATLRSLIEEINIIEEIVFFEHRSHESNGCLYGRNMSL